ncbi:MAG: hypothetical protein ACRECH_15945 [Nitrososphaerales archaeon]
MNRQHITITCDSCAKKGLGRLVMKYDHTDGPSKRGRSYDTYVCSTPGCKQTAIANYDSGLFMGIGQRTD